ncbi:hypothetical protein D1164_23395 [Mariniphaga sediminis]|uniref:Uncharacterized protein n=1 Tax=Mariniphaga sediminis TaxID=1628158 RepID=A0A399CRW2_9BACT|nr:hypothetical protein [Mariniphaga sediminis]RIH62729.1 hypothetical protein D1164_23395 [Mariniphaga sediminis]
MTTTNWISLIAIFISIIAFFVSFVALWKSYFSKFTPIFTVGHCSFRVYPIKNGDEKWFLPSFIIPISITNNGAQIGKIEKLRLKVTFPDLPIANHYEIFHAKWIVNGNRISKNRFEWIKKAVIEDWMPMIVLSRETKTKNIVFENMRWDEPVIQNKILCTLEFKSNNHKKYKQIAQWTFHLTAKTWVAMTEKGTSFSTSSELSPTMEDWIFPKDLHKYTGTKEDITKIKIESSPSYLDYKKNE